MARWIAIFEDNSEDQAGWVRREHAADHFAYLNQHRGKILIGGGLRSAPDEWYCGGLWIMEVETRDEAVALCENDPYFTLGLRKSYQLFVWGKAPTYDAVSL